MRNKVSLLGALLTNHLSWAYGRPPPRGWPEGNRCSRGQGFLCFQSVVCRAPFYLHGSLATLLHSQRDPWHCPHTGYVRQIPYIWHKALPRVTTLRQRGYVVTRRHGCRCICAKQHAPQEGQGDVATHAALCHALRQLLLITATLLCTKHTLPQSLLHGYTPAC